MGSMGLQSAISMRPSHRPASRPFVSGGQVAAEGIRYEAGDPTQGGIVPFGKPFGFSLRVIPPGNLVLCEVLAEGGRVPEYVYVRICEQTEERATE